MLNKDYSHNPNLIEIYIFIIYDNFSENEKKVNMFLKNLLIEDFEVINFKILNISDKSKKISWKSLTKNGIEDTELNYSNNSINQAIIDIKKLKQFFQKNGILYNKPKLILIGDIISFGSKLDRIKNKINNEYIAIYLVNTNEKLKYFNDLEDISPNEVIELGLAFVKPDHKELNENDPWRLVGL